MTTVERKVGPRDSRSGSDYGASGYGRGTGRSIDDVRRRGREALAATRGAAALALDPAIDDVPVRTRARPTRPAVDSPDAAVDVAADAVADAPSGTRYSRATTAPAPQRDGRTEDAPRRAAIRVAPPAPVSTPRAAFVSLVLVVVMAGVLGILVINTKINENAFHLHDLRANQANLDRDEAKLVGELAYLESPNSLAVAARRLGLVRAGTPAYLRLPDGRTLGVPQPAMGSTGVTAGSTATGGANPGQPAG